MCTLSQGLTHKVTQVTMHCMQVCPPPPSLPTFFSEALDNALTAESLGCATASMNGPKRPPTLAQHK